jgi:hypothetical protein
MALKLVRKSDRKPPPENDEKSREEYLIACLKDEMDDPRFSDWERGFITSLTRQVSQGRKLSDKQKHFLERIWDK